MASENGRACKRSRAWHRARWQEHVEAWAESGVSGVEYCRRHGLHSKSLYRWRRVFSQRPATGGGTAPVRPLFAELEVEPLVSGAWGGGVEVVLAGERRLRVARGFDASTLAEVVRVLEGLAC